MINQWLDQYIHCQLYLPALSNGRSGTSFLDQVTLEVLGLPFDDAT